MKKDPNSREHLRRKYRLLLFSFVVLTALPGIDRSYALAQTPTATPTAEELRLQEEKRLLELQRDIELAKKAIRDAQPTTPAPTATPLEGNTTLTDVRIETTMVSYKAMSDVADAVSKEIKTRAAGATNFAIYDAEVIRDWRFHQALFPAFRGQTQDIRNQYVKLLCENANSGVSPYFRQTYCTSQADTSFSAIANQAERSAMKTEAVAGAIGAGSTLIRAFIDLAALFRTETKIEGVAVTIDNSALVAETIRALRNQFCTAGAACPKFYYPGTFHPRIEESETVFRIGQLFVFKMEADLVIKVKTAGRPALADQLNNQTAQRSKAVEVLERIRSLNRIVTNLNAALANENVPQFRRKLWNEKSEALAELGTLGSEANQVAQIAALDAAIAATKASISAIDGPVKELRELNDRFQAFVDQFVKVDDKGSNALALFIRSEDIHRIMDNATSYWLEIKSVAAGGNNRTRKNLIWFFLGARVDHSGGIVAEYALYDNQGAIVTSDKIAYYEGYIKPKNIRRGKLPDTVP